MGWCREWISPSLSLSGDGLLFWVPLGSNSAAEGRGVLGRWRRWRTQTGLLFFLLSSLCLISLSHLLSFISLSCFRKRMERIRGRVEMRREKDRYLLLPHAISHLSLSHLSVVFFFFWTQICRVWEDKRRGQNTIFTFGIKKLRIEIAILVYSFQPIDFLFLFMYKYL